MANCEQAKAFQGIPKSREKLEDLYDQLGEEGFRQLVGDVVAGASRSELRQLENLAFPEGLWEKGGAGPISTYEGKSRIEGEWMPTIGRVRQTGKKKYG